MIRTPADEAEQSARLMDEAYFRQQYIPGRFEYALHLLLVDGCIFYQSTNAYEMAAEYSVKGIALGPVNAVYGAKSNPIAVGTLVEFLRLIDFNGVCCMDYKLIDRQLQILEINPRVGFTLYRDINRFLPAYEKGLRFAGELTVTSSGPQ